MKRNVIFFLDLVLQCLALMIVVTSISAQQGAGVGLIEPATDYETVVAAYDKRAVAALRRPVAVSSDPASASLFTVETPDQVRLLISGRRYEQKGADGAPARVTTIYVDKALPATNDLWIADEKHPVLRPAAGSLLGLNQPGRPLEFKPMPER